MLRTVVNVTGDISCYTVVASSERQLRSYRRRVDELMKIITFILSFFFVFILSSQNNLDCFVKKKESVKLMKKLNQNLRHYSFSDVKNLLVQILSLKKEKVLKYMICMLIHIG